MVTIEIEVDQIKEASTPTMVEEVEICLNAHHTITEEVSVEARVVSITVMHKEVVEIMMTEEAQTKEAIQEVEEIPTDLDHLDQDQAIEVKTEDHLAIEVEMVPLIRMARTTKTTMTIIREAGDITMMVMTTTTKSDLKKMITWMKSRMVKKITMKTKSITILNKWSKISDEFS